MWCVSVVYLSVVCECVSVECKCDVWCVMLEKKNSHRFLEGITLKVLKWLLLLGAV